MKLKGVSKEKVDKILNDNTIVENLVKLSAMSDTSMLLLYIESIDINDIDIYHLEEKFGDITDNLCGEIYERDSLKENIEFINSGILELMSPSEQLFHISWYYIFIYDIEPVGDLVGDIPTLKEILNKLIKKVYKNAISSESIVALSLSHIDNKTLKQYIDEIGTIQLEIATEHPIGMATMAKNLEAVEYLVKNIEKVDFDGNELEKVMNLNIKGLNEYIIDSRYIKRNITLGMGTTLYLLYHKYKSSN